MWIRGQPTPKTPTEQLAVCLGATMPSRAWCLYEMRGTVLWVAVNYAIEHTALDRQLARLDWFYRGTFPSEVYSGMSVGPLDDGVYTSILVRQPIPGWRVPTPYDRPAMHVRSG